MVQGGDGIRDGGEAGVQTCALPIWVPPLPIAPDSSESVATAVDNELQSQTVATAAEPPILRIPPLPIAPDSSQTVATAVDNELQSQTERKAAVPPKMGDLGVPRTANYYHKVATAVAHELKV